MRRKPKDKLFAGFDLHSNNVMIGVINQDGKRVANRKLDCNLNDVIQFLKPLQPQLQSMAVESTFNWYWLVDGLRAQGYPIDLANPAKIKQYSGLKHADDEDDAFHLAELQRLNILPKAHVYDPELRPVRDLLRRRTNLVHQRTALRLSFKSLYTRTTGQALALNDLKKLNCSPLQVMHPNAGPKGCIQTPPPRRAATPIGTPDEAGVPVVVPGSAPTKGAAHPGKSVGGGCFRRVSRPPAYGSWNDNVAKTACALKLLNPPLLGSA